MTEFSALDIMVRKGHLEIACMITRATMHDIGVEQLILSDLYDSTRSRCEKDRGLGHRL